MAPVTAGASGPAATATHAGGLRGARVEPDKAPGFTRPDCCSQAADACPALATCDAEEQGRASRWRSSCAMPEAWVYLLRCRDGSLYTGWTIDLDRRLARHRAGAASRYTASRLPVELALAIPMRDRTTARREEARIKGLPRPAKLALLDRAPTP